jgi:hypothetical protein
VLVCCERRRPTLSAFFGGISATEILQATNFVVSIRWTATSWIFIVRPRSLRSNWMAAGITIVRVKFAIEHGQNFLLVRASLCCGFGIIRFARNSTASCERSGLCCRSGARRNPHLNPLPLAKGEASFLVWYLRSLIQDGIDKPLRSSLIQRRNRNEQNRNRTTGLPGL